MATANTTEHIFSGLKVVDVASCIAGPSAAVIVSDFGADVITVAPPSGDPRRHGPQSPPQPQAQGASPWHLANRNKRGLTLDLQSPSAQLTNLGLVPEGGPPYLPCSSMGSAPLPLRENAPVATACRDRCAEQRSSCTQGEAYEAFPLAGRIGKVKHCSRSGQLGRQPTHKGEKSHGDH